MKIVGIVRRVLCQKEDSGWAKFIIMTENGQEITAVGIAPRLDEGSEVEMDGDFEDNKNYGRQFKTVLITEKLPSQVNDFSTYLQRTIRGIGPITANAIVHCFGKDTFDVISENPEMLTIIPRITLKKAMDIGQQFRTVAMSRAERMFFIQLNISDAMADKIKNKYKENYKEVLTTNPYQMIHVIDGIGFIAADKIAQKVGIPSDASCRVRAAIATTLDDMSNSEGHTFCPRNELVSRTNRRFKIDSGLINNELTACINDEQLIEENGNIYLDKYHKMEISIAKKLIRMLQANRNSNPKNLVEKIKAIEASKNVTLDDVQRSAVMQAITSNLMVITGGPGVGKTTVLDILISYLKEYEINEEDIVLAAPTGKAAKRMTEQTGMKASTIHRLILSLGNTIDIDAANKSKNQLIQGLVKQKKDDEEKTAQLDKFVDVMESQEKIKADTIIVDEMSMVDLNLMYTLLCAVKTGTRVIFVGDVDQLPSIGAGQVLKDLIQSNVIPVVRLVNIYRQAQTSLIIRNAHHINKGESIELDNSKKDFFFVRNTNPDRVMTLIKQAIQTAIPNNFGISPSDVQILCPMKKGQFGIDALNVIMQDFLNPKNSNKNEITTKSGNIFREGDKVMHIKNDYEIEWTITDVNRDGKKEIFYGLGVFNGEVGYIESINNSSKEVKILYDEEKLAVYSFDDLNEIQLAYAMTIHKSQGSEFPAIIMPFLDKSSVDSIFNRNLLYTGVTRAKLCAGLIGDVNIVNYMIRNTKIQQRHSTLIARLTEISKSV